MDKRVESEVLRVVATTMMQEMAMTSHIPTVIAQQLMEENRQLQDENDWLRARLARFETGRRLMFGYEEAGM